MKFFTAVLVLGFLLNGNIALALVAQEMPSSPRAPEYQPDAKSLSAKPPNNNNERVMIPLPETRAFQNFISVPAVNVVVPTVVGVPIEDSLYMNNQFLVKERETGLVVGYYYKQVYTTNEKYVSIRTEPLVANAQYLGDRNSNTTVDFDLPENNYGNVKIVFTVPEGITTSELRFNLAPNVSYPTTVSVQAEAGSGLKTIVATSPVRGSSIRFPETSASYFEVTFTYVQPLRIADISFIPRSINQSVDSTLRFLAQPQMSYEVYLNADTSVSVSTTEAGNLSIDEGVLLLGKYPIQVNPYYVPADVDGDGVRDTLDNCVRTANPAQEDIDRNGRGDACEDFDRDGRMNNVDNCPNNPNYNQSDEDGDGIGDVCDQEESRFTERNKWVPWVGIGMAAIVIGILFTLVATGTRRKEGVGENEEKSDSEGDTSE